MSHHMKHTEATDELQCVVFTNETWMCYIYNEHLQEIVLVSLYL